MTTLDATLKHDGKCMCSIVGFTTYCSLPHAFRHPVTLLLKQRCLRKQSWVLLGRCLQANSDVILVLCSEVNYINVPLAQYMTASNVVLS